MKILFLRGYPGSGKSTLAKTYTGFAHLEADQYFVDEDGIYNFKKEELHLAHLTCQEVFFYCLSCRQNVVVSNTFTTWKELEPYICYIKNSILLGQKMPDYEIIECTGNYKSIHNVPEETIQRMKERWESTESIKQKAEQYLSS